MKLAIASFKVANTKKLASLESISTCLNFKQAVKTPATFDTVCVYTGSCRVRFAVEMAKNYCIGRGTDHSAGADARRLGIWALCTSKNSTGKHRFQHSLL